MRTFPGSLWSVAALAAALSGAPIASQQDPSAQDPSAQDAAQQDRARDADLQAVIASERRRVEVVARCEPAVCSVMDMESPGGGSGVVFDPHGFVLTNYHVVGAPDTQRRGSEFALPEPPEPPDRVLTEWLEAHPGAADADRDAFVAQWKDDWREEHLPRGKHHWRNKKVGLPDGELYEAIVLGVDPGSDLAVLRLLPKHEGQRWPFCELGDSDALLVGETVFAMGNPFLLATDFTPTVTFGIVSGTHRYQEGSGNRMLVYPDCIQVDAPVNPGNSGGPLFNERGDVVGINGRISIGDRGRVNVGVGFAIASNQIKNFLGNMMAGRHAEHGTLDMSAWYMEAPHEDTGRRGVFVQQLFRDAVVAQKGVRLGDELLTFDGERIRTANQLATEVGVLPAGAWVELGYRSSRGDGGYGEERTVTVRLAAVDTGSSADARADTERLASRENRRLAAQALIERMTPGDGTDGGSSDAAGAAATGVTMTLRAPDGAVHRYLRRGEQLRLDVGGTTLVRLGPDDGFAVEGGEVRELDVEQRARLERELRCNALLWSSLEFPARLGTALLDGGSHVLGAPAFRFQLPGAGELATMTWLDGGGAGYVMRDPLRRALVEVHCRGGEVRVVVDGEIEPGWSIEGPTRGPIGDDVFGRPR